MTLTLRPHQTKALKAMHRNTKAQIIIPTAGAKTITKKDGLLYLDYNHFVLVLKQLLFRQNNKIYV